jgi:hypothetical protein
MRVPAIHFSKNSVLLLVVQLVLVSSVAAKYLYERSTCPRAWAQVVGFDPEMPMRGRYLSLQLIVDGCGSTLPNAKAARFPRNFDGTVQSPRYAVTAAGALEFPAKIEAQGNRLTAVKLPDSSHPGDGLKVLAPAGEPCDAMRIAEPVDFFLAEHADTPWPLKKGTELWMEVTVPPSGPPRPIALWIKEGEVLRAVSIE